MLFLEQVVVGLICLPSGRQQFHGDADLRAPAETAEVLIAHAEALATEEFFPWDTTNVERLEDAFGIGGRGRVVQRDSPNVSEALTFDMSGTQRQGARGPE